tara:strand:+ start:114 stop:308 length:195 start_codon:yes stop_codon:yes gene_type:complete
MKQAEIVKLANELSNNDLVELFNIVANRFIISDHFGTDMEICSERPCASNGTEIQINLIHLDGS